jgi:DNA mismatch repair protein MutH
MVKATSTVSRSTAMAEKLSSYEYKTIDFGDPASLLAYAKKLEGHTFQDVIDLGIIPDGVEDTNDYSSKSRKGGMGNLIEERYFGYKANSDDHADFSDAGVELKCTCYDVKKRAGISAGERLVLGMIKFDKSIEAPFEQSHAWEKGHKVLLIYYGRDRNVPSYDQRISYVTLFTPPETDRAIMEDDYHIIQRYITEGRADELSESLTKYLGACTKGHTTKSSMRDQAVYAPGKPARGRAWCFKQSYMNAVLREYILDDKGGESIVKDPAQLRGRTFDELVLSLIEPYIGMTDKEICEKLGIPYTGNKSQWVTITYKILGVKADRAEEFEKANISVRTVRIGEKGSIKENMSLDPFTFKELINENWDDSPLRNYFEETRFFFVAFDLTEKGPTLRGARFWSMPKSDIEGPLRDCWEKTRETIRCGVVLQPENQGNRILNNLPNKEDNPVAHVRPHTNKRAYKFDDGTEIGNISRDGDELPDGRWMTKQSFWINNDYIYAIVKDI